MDTSEKTEAAPLDMTKLTIEQLDEMAQIMIREGYLQEEDRFNDSRIRSRWVLRDKATQVSARQLKERGPNEQRS